MSNLILENGTGVNPNLTKKVKRKFGKICKCPCGNIHFASDVELGFICNKCHKYNSISGTLITEEEYMKSMPDSPVVIRTGDKLEYTKFRDEMQIRSDLFQKGITRKSAGAHNFRKILKQELIREKCYRGKVSDVD